MCTVVSPTMVSMNSQTVNVEDLIRPDPLGSGREGSFDADSGYGSVALNTPKSLEKFTGDSTARLEGTTSDSRPGPVQWPLTAPGDLREFEKVVDKATIAHFQDVLERIEGPLLSYMQKSSRRYQPMAIRLMVLG